MKRYAVCSVVSSLMLLASPASPCSMARSSLPGVFAPDGSVVFAAGAPDEERPGVEQLVFYSASGLWQRTVEVEIDAPDGHLRPLGVDAQDRVWLRVHCYAGFDGRDCDQLLRISAQGDILERRPVSDSEKLWSDGESLFVGREGDGGWISHDLDQGPDPSAQNFKRPTGLCESPLCQHVRWVRGGDGSALFATESETEVHLVRFDADGEEIYRRRYPRVRWAQLGAEDERGFGPIGTLRLGPSGRIYFGQYAYAADCSVYQPPSLVIFDESGELVRVAPTPGPVAAVAELSRELMVLLDDGQVLRLGLDGTEIESWQPDFGRWRLGSVDPEARVAAARTIERSATPEEWIRVYPWAEHAKRQQIEAWLVEMGPEAFERLDDSLFQRIGPAFCQSYGEVAASEALRRFERSLGRNKDLWLATLTSCFEQPPPTAYDYAVSRKQENSYEAREALIVWGPPVEMLEALWQEAKGERQVLAAQELLRLFPRQVEAFDRRLRHGGDEERRWLRQLLLETAIVWHGPEAYESGPHDALLEAARVWQQAADPFVAATGRLVRLGHGDLAVQDVLRRVIRDAVEDPSLTPWLGAALGVAEARSKDLNTWPAGAIEALIELGLSAPVVKYRLSWGEAHGFHWLWHSGNRSVVRALVAKSKEGRTADVARPLLLEVATFEPWYFEPADLQDLLEAEWMASTNLRTWSARRSFFESLGDAVDGLDIPLTVALHRRYREIFLTLARDAATRGKARGFADITWGSQPRRLSRLLTPKDVSELASMSQEGVLAWLNLAAAVGVEPQLVGELESLLESSEPTIRVQAAAALAQVGETEESAHAGALEVIRREGLTGWFRFRPRVYAAYAEALRGELEPLALSTELGRRSAALEALRTIGPTPETLEQLTAAAQRAFDENRLPDIDLIWLLAAHGDNPFPSMLQVLQVDADAGWALHSRRDFVIAFRAWLERDPERVENFRGLETYDENLSRAALRWRADLRKIASQEVWRPENDRKGSGDQ